MNAWLGKLLRSDSFPISLGVLIGQGIPFLALPILTQLYSPDDFGRMAILVSFVTIFGTVACFRYELAIPNATSSQWAFNLFLLSSSIAIGVSMVALLVVTIGLLLGYLHVLSFYLPLGILAMGLFQAASFWAIKLGVFKSIGLARAIFGFAMVTIQIIAALLGSSAGGLMAGAVSSHITAAIILYIACFRIIKKQPGKICYAGLISWLALSKRYITFPKFSIPQALVNVGATMLPIPIFAMLLSETVSGQYWLADRILLAPVAVIGTAISQVFHKRCSEVRRSGSVGDIVLQGHVQLFRLGFFPILIVALWAPYAIELFLGAQWRMTGIYIRWAALSAAFQFSISPLTVVSAVIEKNRELFIVQTIFFGIRILSIFLVFLLFGKDMIVQAFALSGAIVYAAYVVWVMKIVQITWRQYINQIYPTVINASFLFLFFGILPFAIFCQLS